MVEPNNTFETWTNSLIPLPDGFIVPGYRLIQGQGVKGIIIKYALNGDTLWTKSYYSPYGQGSFIRPDKLAYNLNDNVLYLSMTIQNPNNNNIDVYTIKTDMQGNIIWDTIYSTNLRDTYPNMFVDATETLLFCFKTDLAFSALSNYQMQHQYWWLDNAGNITNSFSTPNIKPNSNLKWLLGLPRDLIKTMDGGWIMGTSLGTEIQTAPPNPVLFDPYIYKLDASLNLVWDKKIRGQTPTYTTEIIRILEQPDSSIVAFGTKVDSTYITKGMMIRLSPFGDSLWARYFYVIGNQGDEHILSDAKPTPDGGYILCGQAKAISGPRPQQGWLLKLDSMGCLVPGCHITAVKQVEDHLRMSIKVFPNPATEYINIYIPKTPYPSTLQLQLYDLNGHLLQHHNIPQDDATYILPTEGLAAGTYLLQLLDENGQLLATEKVLLR